MNQKTNINELKTNINQLKTNINQLMNGKTHEYE